MQQCIRSSTAPRGNSFDYTTNGHEITVYYDLFMIVLFLFCCIVFFLSQRAEVDELVLVPLTTLMLRFEAPNKVIQKRYDKLLDYDNLSRKAKDDKVGLSYWCLILCMLGITHIFVVVL